MKQKFCNESKPSTFKIAAVTGNRLTSMRTEGETGLVTVKLNGHRLPISEARRIMLEGVQLYTFRDIPCQV